MQNRTAALHEKMIEVLSTPSKYTSLIFILIYLLLAIPPNGALNDNEEQYFAIADAYVNSDSVFNKEASSIIGGAYHTFVFSSITGMLIQYTGFESTQVIGRLASIFLFLIALSFLFQKLKFSPAQILIVLAVFYLFEQNILGDEWIFSGYEPKTIAYVLVFFSLFFIVDNRYFPATVLLAVACYFHFLISAFWCFFLFLYLFFSTFDIKLLVKLSIAYILVASPIMIWIFLDYGDHLVSGGDSVGPSTSWIYSHFRMAHHVNPFVDKWVFLDWMPGIVLLFGIVYANTQLHIQENHPSASLKGINYIALIFLILSLLATYIDNSGFLGPFNLFRPSSLVLFIFLCHLIVLLVAKHTDEARYSLVILVIIFSVFLPQVAIDNASAWSTEKNRREKQSPVFSYIKQNTEENDVIFINPSFERDFLSFERKSQRPSYVSFKFITSDKAGISEWYRRINQRIDYFSDPCSGKTNVSVEYLLDTAESTLKDKKCLAKVYSDGSYALFKVNQP